MLWNSWINPNIVHLGMKRIVGLSRNYHHPWLKSQGVVMVCGWWIQISSLQNHSLYIQWDIQRVEMLWTAPINPNSLNLGVKSWQGLCQLWPHLWLEKRLRWPFQSPYTNLNLLQPFIMLIMRSWKGLRCCEILESIQTYFILVWNVRVLEPKVSPPTTQKPGCGDGSTWWNQISSLHNHSLYIQWDIERVEMLWTAPISPNSLNLEVKSGEGPSQLWPHPWLKQHVVASIIETTHQSQPSPTIHYTYNKK